MYQKSLMKSKRIPDQLSHYTWHIMSRACWRKRTRNVWSIMGCLKICLLTLFCPNFCLLLRCFQEIALTYLTKLWSPAEESSSFCEVLVNWASLRKSLRHLFYDTETVTLITQNNFKVHYEKSKLWIIKKYFEVKQMISVPMTVWTRMIWTIQGFLAHWNLEEK